MIGRVGAALLVLLALPAAATEGPFQNARGAAPELSVAPETGWRTRASLGGPFPTEPRVYVLHSGGSEAVTWTAQTSEPWVTLSPVEGRLAPGAYSGVAVALEPERCARLGEGIHRARVEFRSSSAGAALVREVELRVLPKRGLRVLPETELSITVGTVGTAVTAPEGARASEPPSGAFVLGNAGALAIRWRARASVDWLRLSPAEGALEAGARGEARLEVLSAQLAPGQHRARVEFENLTDGTGSTTREVLVLVRGLRGLSVLSKERARADEAPGEVGRFLLANEGAGEIRWEVRPSEGWLSAEPREGTLLPGAEVVVSARVARQEESGEPAARPRGALGFVNRTDGVGTTSCWIEPEDGAPSQIASGSAAHELAAALTRFGITWTFDRPYPVGRFVNGDPWVVGPVQIVSIDPPSRRAGNRTTNGSMVDPSPRSGLAQGYDSATYGQYSDRSSFDPGLNVAAGLAPWQPLLLRSGSSLVSTISHPSPGARPQLSGAAILTVLDAPAPAGAFRPPYCGADKTVRFHREELRTELLAKLLPVASTPAWPEVEGWFERPWIDHVSLWAGNYIHPSLNMPNYGRELCDQVSTAALMLHLDVPDERKETLLVRFVQLGIDLWGIVQDGGSFPPAAGHMSGRKWPILFAGLLLDDAAMSAVGLDLALEFGEDGQTFHVEETPAGSGTWNDGHGGYGPKHAGLADWGTAHTRQPWNDDADWFGDPYRLCCSANTWWGELLACYVMGAKPLWNHDALFDYQDRYLSENERRGITDWRLSWRPFYLDMWREYRPRY